MLKTGIAWNELPAAVVGCSGVTCWRRVRDWTEAGVWSALHELPRELGCGSGVTCWRRLREWQQAGVWPAAHRVVLDQLAHLACWTGRGRRSTA